MKIIAILITTLTFSFIQAQNIKYQLKGSDTFLTKAQVDSISAKYGNNIKFNFQKSNNEMLAILDISKVSKEVVKDFEKGTSTSEGNAAKINYGVIKYKNIDDQYISKEKFIEAYKTGKYARHYEMEEREGKYDITWSLRKNNEGKIDGEYINLKGTKLPDFNLKDLKDNTITTSSLYGKITVLNIWFIGCKPCEKEIPTLNRVTEVFKKREDIVFLAPAWNNDKKQLMNFLEKRPFKYDVLVNADALIKEMNIGIYPTHLIVDKEGTITEVILGAKDNIEELLINAINKQLK